MATRQPPPQGGRAHTNFAALRDRDERLPLARPVAFVFSGGASLAASQVGMVRALQGAGIAPDILVGVSAGAINAAFLATRPGPLGIDELDRVWRAMSGRTLFPGGAAAQVLRVLRGRGSLFPNEGLRRVLESVFGSARLEQSSARLGVVAARVPSGLPKLFTRGPVVEALLASAAIPGVFPCVIIEGVRHVDGGVVTNVPLVPARILGAQSFVVLDAGPPCASPGHDRSTLLSTLAAAVTVATRQRIATELPRIAAQHRVVYIAAPCNMTVLPNDFSRTDSLLDAGLAVANQILSRGWGSGPGYTGEPHFHDDVSLASSWGLDSD